MFAIFQGVGLNLEIVLQDKDMSAIKKALEAGLVTFVWGEEANNKEMIKQLRRLGADGIIYDRFEFISNKFISSFGTCTHTHNSK